MSVRSGIVCALHIGMAREVVGEGSGAWWDKPWRTGFHKQPVEGPCWLGYQGFAGDEQADRAVHGGVDKAVCVYPSEHYPFWRESLALPGMPLGAFGENLTTQGLLESNVCIGDIFVLGETRVQITQPRQPCWKLARRWRIKNLALRVEQTGYTGFYFRVLRHGQVRAGDTLTLESRPHAEWTILRCNQIMHHEPQDIDGAAGLATVDPLSGSWKDRLWSRVSLSATGTSTRKTRLLDSPDSGNSSAPRNAPFSE